MSQTESSTSHLPRGVSRRDILRYSLAGAGLVALGPLSRFIPTATGAPQALKRLVVINCYGGNDTLNMVVPITLSQYAARRGAIALTAGQCQSLNGGPQANSAYMFHPTMPKLATRWRTSGQVAAVNRVGYPTPNLSHFISQDIFSLGVRGSFAPLHLPQSGWLARFCDAYAPTPLGAVAVGVGRPLDIIGGVTANPLPVASLSAFKILGAGTNGTSYTPAHYHRLNYAKKQIDGFSGTGRPASQKAALADAHALTDQVQGALTGYVAGATYTTATISKRMKDIATLIQGGFETRVFYTGFSGFDTHGGQGTIAGTGAQPTLLGQLDDALESFAADCESMGVWNDTVVLVITEFGRRNYVNGSSGTDHGHAFAALLTGGAVRGGVRGPLLTDADLTSEYPTYGVDFRSIYKEILDGHMDANPAPVFPEALEMETTLGIV